MQTPLCVDLDGTLVRSDTGQESLLALLRKNPLYAFVLPVWFLRGKAYLKKQIALRVSVDPARLPYNRELLEFLLEQRAAGRKIYLATATDMLIAEPIAQYLDLFDGVFASDGSVNMSGHTKREHLEKAFGPKGFSYVGNSSADRHVWVHSQEAFIVHAPSRLIRHVRGTSNVVRVFPRTLRPLRALRKLLRVHQWPKNLLLFIPLFTAHVFDDPTAVTEAVIAFCSFCLASSAGYVLNDLLDLQADRAHPEKIHRPFASGDVPLGIGFLSFPLLLLSAVFLAMLLPPGFLWLLSLYLASTILYSLVLKNFAGLDVIILALFYTLRIFAGGVAVTVPISEWLILFSIFFFLSLALVKRVVELMEMEKKEDRSIPGRSYRPEDRLLLEMLGISSGYIALLVFTFYLQSEAVQRLYQNPAVLWVVFFCLLYALNRLWLRVHHGQVHGDPVVALLRDKVMYVLGVICLAVVVGAI